MPNRKAIESTAVLFLGLLSSACADSERGSNTDSTRQEVPSEGNTLGQTGPLSQLNEDLIRRTFRLVELVPSANAVDWTCVRGLSGQPCSAAEKQATRPSPQKRILFSVSGEPSMHAELCTSPVSCREGKLDKRSDRLSFSRTDKNPSEPTLDLFRAKDGGWFGEINVSSSKKLGDVIYEALWKGKVSVRGIDAQPSFAVHSKWRLDPIYITFDQPMECGSFHPQLTSPSGTPVKFSVVSTCSKNQPESMSMRGTGRSFEIRPQEPWKHASYVLSLPSMQSRSGLRSQEATNQRVERSPVIESAAALDFEAPDLAGWDTVLGYTGCKRVTQFSSATGSKILPKRGEHMLACLNHTQAQTNQFRGQFLVPENAKHFLFSVASGNVGATPGPNSFESGFSLSIRDDLGNKPDPNSEIKWIPSKETPKGWSGWTEVRVPVAANAKLIDFSFFLPMCSFAKGAGCSGAKSEQLPGNRVLFDDFRFE